MSATAAAAACGDGDADRFHPRRLTCAAATVILMEDSRSSSAFPLHLSCSCSSRHHTTGSIDRVSICGFKEAHRATVSSSIGTAAAGACGSTASWVGRDTLSVCPFIVQFSPQPTCVFDGTDLCLAEGGGCWRREMRMAVATGGARVGDTR